MTTENFKAVLTEEEAFSLGVFRRSFRAAMNDIKCAETQADLCYRVSDVEEIITRLADEIVRLRGVNGRLDPLDPSFVRYIGMQERIQELEAQVTALKKLDDDNNADSVRRLKQMEEDKRTIKELEAENSKLKSHDCWKEVTGG